MLDEWSIQKRKKFIETIIIKHLSFDTVYQNEIMKIIIFKDEIRLG